MPPPAPKKRILIDSDDSDDDDWPPAVSAAVAAAAAATAVSQPVPSAPPAASPSSAVKHEPPPSSPLAPPAPAPAHKPLAAASSAPSSPAKKTPYTTLSAASAGDDDEDDQESSMAVDGPARANGTASAGKKPNSDSDSDEDMPLAKMAPRKASGASTASKKKSQSKAAASDSDADSDDEDAPLASLVRGSKGKGKSASKSKAPARKRSAGSDADHAKPAKVFKKSAAAKKKHADSSDDDESMAVSSDEDFASASGSRNSNSKTKKPAKAPAKKKNAPAKKEELSSDNDDKPSAASSSSRRPPAKKVKAEPAPSKKQSPQKKAAKKSNNNTDNDDDDDDTQHKWWLEENQDDSVKWRTLAHNGPVFPAPYVPHGVKMKYDGQEIDLDPAAEEVASFFGQLLGTDYATNPVFQKNFFDDFLAVLAKCERKYPMIKEFGKCDFTQMSEHFAAERERKKSATKEEKLAAKEEKARLDEQFGWCMLDGRKEKVGNYRIEPPGLFRGRGNHPKTGSLKLRVAPEQVTINIGSGEKVPEPPEGHRWGKVVHDQTVTWLAMWKENVNDNIKYVFLAANSSLKGQSDFKKFEKARELKRHVHRIRKDYIEDLKNKDNTLRQRATAMYLIDRLALRAGNEKGEDEADTVGCCSLRYEHVSLEPPNKIIFDFLGKDSIRYYNEVEVDEQVFKNLRIFKREPKGPGDPLFERITTTLLNKHLSTYMQGLTAKVFRTYNASHTFQEELKKTPTETLTVAEKVLAYNRANRQVAILCNHQRSVPKAHGTQMTRIQDKLLGIKYERGKVKKQILSLDPKLGKKRPELKEPESDVDDAFVARYESEQAEKEAAKDAAKLEKENEKRKAAGEKPLKTLDKSSASGTTRTPSLEQLEKKLAKLDERVQQTRMQMIDKDENKTTALGTSKINYIDPRISATWCKKHDVPVEKIFNRSLREKFTWAMDADADWEF